MVSKDDIQKAAKIYKAKIGTIQMTNQFLMEQKGFTYTECLEAMNLASNGECLKAIWG